MEKVSVVIPTYQGEAKLERAIKSIMNQTYANIELIVVDDNGRNTIHQRKTEQIISSLRDLCGDRELIYIVHEHNKNGSAARNTGIHNATGKYICFLDDDDVYMPLRVSKSVACLEKFPECTVVLTFVQAELTNGKYKFFELNETNDYVREMLLDFCYLGTGSNIFALTSAVRKIDGFDERFKRNQDVEFMIRLMKENKIHIIKETLIFKGNNGTVNIPNYETMLEIKKMFKQKFSIEISQLSVEDLNKYHRTQSHELYYVALLSGKTSDKINEYNNYKKYADFTWKDIVVLFIGILHLYKPFIMYRAKSIDK